MEWGVYTRLVGEMVDAGAERLGLAFDRDCARCDWLPEAIAFAKGRGVAYVFLATDGQVATADTVLRCMEAGLDSLTFARRAPGNAAGFLASLKAARRIRDEGNFACGLYASTLQDESPASVDALLPYVDEHYWLPRDQVQPCWSAFAEGHITYDGRLSACRLDSPNRLVMADLNEVSLRDGWHSTRFQELRAAQLRKEVAGTPCAQCRSPDFTQPSRS
jgi:hypothetical protein